MLGIQHASPEATLTIPKSAIIAGSTGLVGSHFLHFLLSSPEYSRITALARRPSGITDPKLHEQIVDFAMLPDLPVADVVFCALGTTIRQAGSQAEFRKVDLEYVVRLAERTLAAGAKQFLVVSSVGADAESRNFYLRTKGQVEGMLRVMLRYPSDLELPLRSDKEIEQALHIFRPSFLVGERKQNRPGERIGMAIAEFFKFAMVGSLRKYRPIRAELVAKAMVNAAHLGSPGIHVYEYDEIVGLAG